MTTQTQTVQTVPKTGEVEFIPFGMEDKIRLSTKIVRDLIAIPSKSGKLPEEKECMKFLMLCRNRRLDPFQGDCFLMGYDGRDGGTSWSLITAHQAFLKRAEIHPEFDGFDSGVIVREGEDGEIKEREGDFLIPGDILLGGWCVVHFKNRNHPMKRKLNLHIFKAAYGRWTQDPAGMIVKCAEADALRSAFPTLLGGLYTDNERPTIDISTSNSAKVPDLGPSVSAMLPHNTANSAGEQPKTAQEPSGGATTQTDAPNAPQAEASTQGTHTSAPAEQTSDRPEDDALKSVRLLMEKSGVVEAQVMQHCRKTGMAKEPQKKLTDLSTAKLQTLAKAWHNVLPEIARTERPGQPTADAA